MGRYGRGKALLNVRSRAIILLCLPMISMLPSATAHGLSIDPVLDKVISITKLNESEVARPANSAQGTAKSEGNSRPAADTTSIKSTQIPVGSVPESMPTIVTSPMPELQPVETFEAWQNIARLPEPISPPEEQMTVAIAAVEPIRPSILQSSSHGWKLFDVAWYWWVILVGAGYYAVKKILHPRRHSKLNNTIVS